MRNRFASQELDEFLTKSKLKPKIDITKPEDMGFVNNYLRFCRKPNTSNSLRRINLAKTSIGKPLFCKRILRKPKRLLNKYKAQSSGSSPSYKAIHRCSPLNNEN